jgi:hypothetical protein
MPPFLVLLTALFWTFSLNNIWTALAPGRFAFFAASCFCFAAFSFWRCATFAAFSLKGLVERWHD